MSRARKIIEQLSVRGELAKGGAGLDFIDLHPQPNSARPQDGKWKTVKQIFTKTQPNKNKSKRKTSLPPLGFRTGQIIPGQIKASRAARVMQAFEAIDRAETGDVVDVIQLLQDSQVALSVKELKDLLPDADTTEAEIQQALDDAVQAGKIKKQGDKFVAVKK